MDEQEKKQHQCDCENEECDCEAVDEDVVMLEDEEGNQIPFYHIATLDHDGKDYACLQQADDDDPIVEIFELQEVEEGEEVYYNFLPVDDDLYDELYKQLEEEIAAMSDDECDDPDCECLHHDDN